MLEDIAILTGGRVVSEEIGLRLDKVSVGDLGKAHRVVIDKDTTTIVGGAGAREAIAGRCQDLHRQIDASTSDYDREKLQERLAKLSGGVAVVRVGAPSETELKASKEAFDDAVASTRAAVAEGIVPGAGWSLLRAIPVVEREAAACEGDERTGVLLLRRALEEPTRQIAENANVDGGVVVDRMRTGTGTIGFDAAKGVYVDLVEAGIIDPVKVVRLALENAVSVAGTLLLAEATVTEVPEEKHPAAPVEAA
jgi:chaperonin GroEL